MGATLHRGARASHSRGLSCSGAQAPDTQAQQLWLTGPAAPRHVGPSQTRARTRVSCIGRQILNHCATREAPGLRHFSEKNRILSSGKLCLFIFLKLLIFIFLIFILFLFFGYAAWHMGV